ncbi:MAG: proton-conducting transporter membrane subunit [Negativicutes bacterium]|jgi:hydrogenase-4 component F
MELIIILSALLGAAIFAVVSKKRIVIETATAVAALTAISLSAAVVYNVAYFGAYYPFSFFAVDELGAIVLLIICSLDLAVSIYSVAYLRQESAKQIIEFKKVKQYFALLNVFVAVMVLTATASSPIFTWIAIEATTLSATFLISFYNKKTTTEAAWKYLIINSIGLLLGFFGTLLYFTALQNSAVVGIATWRDLLASSIRLDPQIAKIAFVFVLIGYGTKAGLAPMHTWLPDAHGKAPAPISALLSGVLLNVAFISILRFKAITDTAVGFGTVTKNLLIMFGLCSIIVSALAIFTQKNYKRLLAYSSIENMGIVAIGFGLGGFGAFAGLLHIIYHSLIKSALFLLAGSVFLRYSTTKIANIRGMCTALPITGVMFFAGFLVITGMPPFGLFFTKIYIFAEAVQWNVWIACLALVFISILFIGFLKHFSKMFFGSKPPDVKAGETDVWLIIPPLLLIAAALFLSLYMPQFLQLLIKKAVTGY